LKEKMDGDDDPDSIPTMCQQVGTSDRKMIRNPADLNSGVVVVKIEGGGQGATTLGMGAYPPEAWPQSQAQQPEDLQSNMNAM
jgi:hypothetical protein